MKQYQYQIGQEVVPGYTLVRPLASGMAGDVWVARGAGGMDVALKIVRSLSALGGHKELKALKTIRNVRHPNLCPVHGFWTKDDEGRLLEDGESDAMMPEGDTEGECITELSAAEGTMDIASPTGSEKPTGCEKPAGDALRSHAEQLIVVMGLGDCTLHDRLHDVRKQAGLTPDDRGVRCGLEAQETIHFLRPAADAIDELNQQHNIYHCDIKPQNILIVGGGAQVCDFGLANRIEGDSRKTRHAFATPAYAAPEVLDGMTYSRGVDQYSLAVTYYELRTGQLPFDISSVAKILQAKCSGDLDLAGVSSAERKVIQKAMQVDPAERYTTCTQFINELAVASGVDRRPGITPLRLIAMGLALVVVAVMLVLTFQRFTGAKPLPEARPMEVADKSDATAAGSAESLKTMADEGDAGHLESGSLRMTQDEHEPERIEMDLRDEGMSDVGSARVEANVPKDLTRTDDIRRDAPVLLAKDEARFIWLFARYGVRGPETAGISERQLTQALELDPSSGQAYRDRAIARTTLGKTTMARQDFEEAIKLMGENFHLRQEYAKLLARMSVTPGSSNRETGSSNRDEFVEKCMQQCAAALEIRQHATGPRLLRAEFLFRQKKNAEAKKEAEKLKENSIDPEQRSYAWNLLGLIALREGNQSDAFANLKSAIAADPENAEAHLNLGKASRDVGLGEKPAKRAERLEQSLNHYTLATQIKPQLREQILPLIAQVQEDQGMFEAAIGTYTSLIEGFGPTVQRFRKRAGLYDQIGNLDEATKNRARALDLE